MQQYQSNTDFLLESLFLIFFFYFLLVEHKFNIYSQFNPVLVLQLQEK